MPPTLADCRQHPFNTTLMGVIRSVLDYYGIDVSTGMAYGLTGHAFVINIHNQLCPSGPYCWKRSEFETLLKNLGLAMTDLGFYDPSCTEQQREDVDAKLKAALDDRVPCSLINMENQLIASRDETGFLTAQPWAPHMDFPPAHLQFGTWKEIGDNYHVNFYTFTKTDPGDRVEATRAALSYAADMFANPTEHTSEPYGAGAKAYEYWMQAVEGGAGGGHGNWWNATVWAECRAKAVEFMRELAEAHPAIAAQATALADEYDGVAGLLLKIGDKALEAAPKVELLKQAQQKDAACAKAAGQLAGAI